MHAKSKNKKTKNLSPAAAYICIHIYTSVYKVPHTCKVTVEPGQRHDKCSEDVGMLVPKVWEALPQSILSSNDTVPIFQKGVPAKERLSLPFICPSH